MVLESRVKEAKYITMLNTFIKIDDETDNNLMSNYTFDCMFNHQATILNAINNIGNDNPKYWQELNGFLFSYSVYGEKIIEFQKDIADNLSKPGKCI